MIVSVACQEPNKPVNKSLNTFIFYFSKDNHMMCPKVKNISIYYHDYIIMTILFDVCKYFFYIPCPLDFLKNFFYPQCA